MLPRIRGYEALGEDVRANPLGVAVLHVEDLAL